MNEDINQQDYRDAFSAIKPSVVFQEQLVAKIKPADQKSAGTQTRQQARAQERYQASGTIVSPNFRPRKRALSLIASVLILGLVIFGFWQLLPGISQSSDQSGHTVPVKQPSQSGAVFTPPTTTAKANNSTSEDSSVDLLYANLKLIDSDPVQYPLHLGENTISQKIPGLYANDLQKADIIIQATILQAKQLTYALEMEIKPEDYKDFLTPEENKYRQDEINTMLFEARIDSVIYKSGETTAAIGDSIIIQETLNGIEEYDPYLYPRKGRQYIIPLITRESMELLPTAEQDRYLSIAGNFIAEGHFVMLYPQTPQIELTLDDGSLFYGVPATEPTVKGAAIHGGGWTDLITSDARKVKMPADTGLLYRDWMWYRSTRELEQHLKALLE